MDSLTYVLYDEDCPLCRRLAGFMQRYSSQELSFFSWQSFCTSDLAKTLLSAEQRDLPPTQLRAFYKGKLVEGESAWALLIQLHPGLSSLSWIAQKLGLEMQTARALQKGGSFLRRFCPGCPGKFRK